jgi:hypothetical protein
MAKQAQDRRPVSQLPPQARKNATKVEYPRCKALPGHRCRNGKAVGIGAHADRIRAAAAGGFGSMRREEQVRQLAEYRANAAGAD